MRYSSLWPNRRPHGPGGSLAIWPNEKGRCRFHDG